MTHLICRLLGHRPQWMYGHLLPLAPMSVFQQCSRCWRLL